MAAQRWAITRPDRHTEFRAVLRDGRLTGWYWVRPAAGVAVLSCGLTPDECGRGLGATLMELALDTWSRSYPGLPLELSVRAFDERAIRTYTRAGFRLVAPKSPDFLTLRLD